MFWEITTWINIPKKSLLPDSECRAVIILLTRVISILLCLTEIICFDEGKYIRRIKPIITYTAVSGPLWILRDGMAEKRIWRQQPNAVFFFLTRV